MVIAVSNPSSFPIEVRSRGGKVVWSSNGEDIFITYEAVAAPPAS
jgi:hypothetical protein